MAQSQRPQAFPVGQYPGIGGLSAAAARDKARQLERKAAVEARAAAAAARLLKDRTAQAELAKSYLKAPQAPKSPTGIQVFNAVLVAFLTAEAVVIDGRRVGATQVAADSVTVDPELAPLFAEDSKVLAEAVRGATWAKTALVRAGNDLRKEKPVAVSAV